MRDRCLFGVIAAIAVFAAGCGQELEPPWEVRTYIAPATDTTFTENMSVVRKEWVCPVCGYSTEVAPYNVGGTDYQLCPNPFGLGAHPATVMREAPVQERLCGHVDAGAGDVLTGRPFHPGEPDPMAAADWDNATPPWAAPTAANASSYVTVRAAGLYSDMYDTGGGAAAYLMDPDANPATDERRARFLVIEPGATRAAASARDLTEVSDVDNVADETEWTIHVNPYRVSDGDEWFVRQYEDNDATGDTAELRIEVYSKLYGSDFSLDSTADATVDLTTFDTLAGCTIVTDSGALRIECPRMVPNAGNDATYVMGFTIASNTQTLPCPEEVDYDDVAGCGDLYAGLDEPDPATTPNTPFPSKEAWMIPTSPGGILGYVATETGMDVVEKATNGGFNTDQCWPYRIPSGAVGTGTVIVQWADGLPGALETPVNNTYYRNGSEWYYHADLWLGDDPAHPDMYQVGPPVQLTWEGAAVGNDDVAQGTPIGDRAHYYMISSSFMVTRPDLPLTGDDWATTGNAIETDTTAGSGGYTRVIVGEGADPTVANSSVAGVYNPGASTAERPFYVGNRVSEPTLVSPLYQGGSGAHFRDAAISGDATDPSAGDPDPLSMFALRCNECGELFNSTTNTDGGPCPNPGCGGTLEWPVTLEWAEGESYLEYAALEPLLTWFAAENRGVTMPVEALKFGPGSAMVAKGASEVLQTVSVDIPKYQPPSVPAGATAVENDLANDNPYTGTMVAYTRYVDDSVIDFTDDFGAHDAATSPSWTQYTGNIPYSGEGALVLEDGGGNGTGTHTTNLYTVASMRYEWRAMPRYTASGPGQSYFILAEDDPGTPALDITVGNESRPDDGIWTRFTGYSTQPGGDLAGAGGWSVEVREGGLTVWSQQYRDIQTVGTGLINTSDASYEFAIEIGPDLYPKFYYQGRLLGTSSAALGASSNYAIALLTTSGNTLVDQVTVRTISDLRALEMDKGWDTYYVSPNDGEKIPAALAEAVRAGQAGATDAAVPGAYFCPVSDISYSRLLTPEGGICDFTGAALDVDSSLPESMLAAEEFDVFDLLVSVLRKADLASDQRTVDLGWVAPGVPSNQATTTVGALRAGSVPEPADVSGREDLTLRNEGNVPVASAMRSGHMFRPEIDAANRSHARWAQSVPSTVGTLFRYRPADPVDVAFTGAGLGLLRQESDGAAGMDATARLQAGVRAAGGDPYGPRTMPVPMGQPVGNYTGEMLVFIDLNANGDLDFLDSNVGPTSTSLTAFDPEVDEPFEPVSAFATRMRVVESRLPQNDYYSKDASPTAIYDVSRDSMQVLWTGNRPSAAGGTLGGEAAAGVTAADMPSPTTAFNVLYANAVINGDAAATADSYYRGWLWASSAGVIDDARVLSDSAAGVMNTAPAAYTDPNNNARWAMWHRQTLSTAGVGTELRFDTSADTQWSGSAIDEFIYGTSGAKQGLTGFVRQGAANNHWLFWHGGSPGSESIRYRWDFDPTSASIDNNEAPLPVSNAVARSAREDIVYEDVLECVACGAWQDPHVYEAGDPCPAAGCGGTLAVVDSHGYRKPAHYPFTYVKHPSVFERTAGGRPFVHTFFSGLIRATGNADICWVRFNEDRMQDQDLNYGKVAFPEVSNNDTYMPAVHYAAGVADWWAGEQMRPTGVGRQVFQSRGIDWMVSEDNGDDPADGDTTNFATEPDVMPRALGGYGDPELFVGVVTNTGGVRNPTLYRVGWTRGTYERSTGTYVVVPTLMEITPTGDDDIAIPPGHPHAGHLNELLEPSTRMTVDAGAFAVPPTVTPEEWPSVRLRISPASGTIQWSAPLFNPDNPADTRAVFNTAFDADILDVLVYANYTPYIYRVTTDGANDDSPSAFYDLGDSSRLTVFWRRSFGTTDTPHFGRAAFMHKTYTTALQVGQPPMNPATITITDLTDGGTVPYAADGPNGIITITDEARVGNLLRITYDSLGPAGTQTEVHRVVGWSTETPVPVNAVVSEGALRVTPEIYSVPDGLGGAGVVDVVRYWLFWASPRSTYDIREAGSNGQNVKQSADVYCAVVAPEYGSLLRDAEVPRTGP